MRKLSLILICLTIGCTSHTDPSVQNINHQTLSQQGEFVGELPDGRKVYRWKIEMGSSYNDHWLYSVGESITINKDVRQGKTTANEVEIIINGQKYIKQ